MIFNVTMFIIFLQGFDDSSALLKHELAYCLGQMQVQFNFHDCILTNIGLYSDILEGVVGTFHFVAR